MTPRIAVVVPTVRPEQYKSFVAAWDHLFKKHKVMLITVWDGGEPHVSTKNYSQPSEYEYNPVSWTHYFTKPDDQKLFCRFTDACRNIGFVVAAHMKPTHVLTLDDDVTPIAGWEDPIQAHLDVLQKRVPLGWMNTAHDDAQYLRGVPYNIRSEAPVMLSHGVWVGTPDFDGETQLALESGKGVPYTLPYYVGHIPKEVLFPLCGMNVMVKAEALPYFYFAPMGPDTNVVGLNRFADIWMGISLKEEFDRLGWACYTGGSVILHTRASDAKKNFEQEKLGREWNEEMPAILDWYESLGDGTSTDKTQYFRSYNEKRQRYSKLIQDIFNSSK